MKNKAQEILSHLLEDGFDYDATIHEVDALRKDYQQQHDEENANAGSGDGSLIHFPGSRDG